MSHPYPKDFATQLREYGVKRATAFPYDVDWICYGTLPYAFMRAKHTNHQDKWRISSPSRLWLDKQPA